MWILTAFTTILSGEKESSDYCSKEKVTGHIQWETEMMRKRRRNECKLAMMPDCPLKDTNSNSGGETQTAGMESTYKTSYEDVTLFKGAS